MGLISGGKSCRFFGEIQHDASTLMWTLCLSGVMWYFSCAFVISFDFTSNLHGKEREKRIEEVFSLNHFIPKHFYDLRYLVAQRNKYIFVKWSRKEWVRIQNIPPLVGQGRGCWNIKNKNYGWLLRNIPRTYEKCFALLSSSSRMNQSVRFVSDI